MSTLENYLQQHFLNAAQFASHCGIRETQLQDWIQQQLIPRPSYVVTGDGHIVSDVFGALDAAGATPGDYFHPDMAVWVARAQRLLKDDDAAQAGQVMQQEFGAQFGAALTQLHRSTWQLNDGVAHDADIQARTEAAWSHFLKGTFGVCVAHPVSEAAIARKLVLQEKLRSLTDDGNKTNFTRDEAQIVLTTIAEFDQVAMAFSPADYARSSRKRLIDDMRARLLVAAEPG
ncbi:MAG: hypothetical protein KGM99_02335 [Burkholderiales bacterium]|nr:hypothetical protein [Burkholderiales bacterium]